MTLAIEVVSDPLQHPVDVRLRAQSVIDQVKAVASGTSGVSDLDGGGGLGNVNAINGGASGGGLGMNQMQAEALLALCASLISTGATCKAYLQKKLFGIGVLQQFVTNQWQELPETFKQRISMFIVECCRSLCVAPNPPTYAVKSKLGVLFAEMARYMSTDSDLDDSDPKGASNVITAYVLPEITTWPGTRGIELACLALRWIPDGTSGTIIEAIPPPRKRILLKSLHAALPEVISFSYQAMNKSYAALCQSETQKGQEAEAEEYKHVVEAALSMALAYAEWAPISLLHQSGIINACGILMRDKRFRDTACDILRQQSACTLKPILVENTKQHAPGNSSSSNDATQVEIFNAKAAARALFEAFSGPCQESLSSEYASLGLENVEYGHLLCGTMVIWGKNHVKLLEGSDHLNLFLKMLIAFFQHQNTNLALSTMEFWMLLVKEAFQGDTKENTQKRALLQLPEGFFGALLDVMVLRMQKPLLKEMDDYPAEYFDSSKDFHEKSATLRQRIVELARVIVRNAPEEVFHACLGNIEKIFVLLQQNPNQKGLDIPLEAVTHLLATATAACSSSVAGQSPSLEALLVKLLNFPLVMMTQGGIIMQFVKCLESIGGHIHRVVPVIKYLLTLLRADVGVNLSTDENKAARQQAATTVLSLASKDEVVGALQQHLAPLMEQIQEMWNQRAIRPGERNALYEAILVISAACNQQQKALDWLWSETCQHWSNPQWQEKALSDGVSMLRTIGIKSCACVANDPTFDPVKNGEERLQLYHGIQLVERLSRRLLAMKRRKGSDAYLAIVPHFKWTIPVVARLLRCLHYIASPEGRKLLGACESALDLSRVEAAFMLGITPNGVSPSAFVSASAGRSGFPMTSSNLAMEGDTIESLRTFIRGMRDSSYQFLGILCQIKVADDNLAVRIGFKSFYDTMSSASNEFYAVVMENIQYQGDRATRMLVRAFICQLVKHCPQASFRQWLGTILPPLLQHMHTRLTTAWHSHLTGQNGCNRNPSVQQHQLGGVSTDVSEELLAEGSMREITREHLSLILIIATGDEQGHTYFRNKKGGKSSQNEVTPTVLEWLSVECVQAASCLMATAVAALTWPDTETGMKAIKACRIVVGMTPKAAQFSALHSFIAKDMFTACMSCLTLSSHADFQAEILSVLRDIIVSHSDLVSPMLLSMPNINEGILSSFHQAMQTRGSEKDQRNLVRKLLLRSGGVELKALAQQHSPGSKIPQLQSSDFGKKKNAQAATPLLETVLSTEQSPLTNLF